jgi:seryl-tRNA synthetase
MIDIKHLNNNQELYIKELTKRFGDSNTVAEIAKTHQNLVKNQKQLDDLRAVKNAFNLVVKDLSPEQKKLKLEEMKEVSIQITNFEKQVSNLKTLQEELLCKIPNLTSDQSPIGKDDQANIEIFKNGTVKTELEFGFLPKNYYDLPIFKRDYLGNKGVEAFGTRGYYIKGTLAKLQKAMFEIVNENIAAYGFEYVICPILVNDKTLFGTGFFPSGIEDTYKVSAGDKTFYLVGTSEAPLMFLNSNSTVNLNNPIKITSQTPCFRKEAGSYGKDVAGGIRVHQFDKTEMVIICKPEQGPQMFDEFIKLATKNIELFELAYHHLEVSTGDMSIKNHRQIDLEAWFPAQGKYRELCSASNCTDYQTRALNITYLDQNGIKQVAHSLNCTGVVNRMLFAILEQNQLVDGSVKLPKLLAQKIGQDVVI